MDFLDIKLTALTPVFLSGADQKSVEARAPSVKGLLRWWWRACQGHEFGGNMARMAEEEGVLFGSAERKLKSTVQVQFSKVGTARELKRGASGPRSGVTYSYVRDGVQGTAESLHYLGYGPVRLLSKEERGPNNRPADPAFAEAGGNAKKGVLFIRPAFEPDTQFSLRLAWPEGNLSPEQETQILRAIAAWVTYGGIGCRSRKGWGALEGEIVAGSREKLDGWKKTYVTAVKEFAGSFQAPELISVPPFPIISQRRVWLGGAAGGWKEALGKIGLDYKKFRRVTGGKRSWICGSANPRRASSVLLSVIREGAQFRGIMCFFPCAQSLSSNDGDELKRTVALFQGIGKN